jgi:hypothetical protein
MEDKDWAWRELEKDLDLYKFYLEFLLKAVASVLAITGAITSFYFAHAQEPLMVYSLLLPFVINAGFSVACSLSIGFAQVLRRDHYEICARAGIQKAYEMSPLLGLLYLCSVVSGLITAGLAALFAIRFLR